MEDTRRRVGMADEEDSKSFVGNNVWVQVPPPASNLKEFIQDWEVRKVEVLCLE